MCSTVVSAPCRHCRAGSFNAATKARTLFTKCYFFLSSMHSNTIFVNSASRSDDPSPLRSIGFGVNIGVISYHLKSTSTYVQPRFHYVYEGGFTSILVVVVSVFPYFWDSRMQILQLLKCHQWVHIWRFASTSKPFHFRYGFSGCFWPAPCVWLGRFAIYRFWLGYSFRLLSPSSINSLDFSLTAFISFKVWYFSCPRLCTLVAVPCFSHMTGTQQIRASCMMFGSLLDITVLQYFNMELIYFSPRCELVSKDSLSNAAAWISQA